MEIQNKIDTHKHVKSEWVPYDFNVISNRPPLYGRYLVCRKDGKVHWETWNGTGWAYNNNEIRYWLIIPEPPIKFDNIKI